MRTFTRWVVFALLCVSSLSAQEVQPVEGAPEPEPTAVQLPEVLVTGEQPGPGLWKLSKVVGDSERVLWIVGMHEPLSKEMTWRSKEIERIVTESQRVVTWLRIDFDYDAGFFGTLGALPLLLSADKNVDGVTLSEVLPADVYSQWSVLKAKYLGDDDGAEKLRPTFAWQRLRAAAHAQAGLTSRPVVEPAVERLARKHRVKIVRPKEAMIEVKIDNPRQLLKKFKVTPLGDEDCFAQSIAQLEPRIEIMKARANAWAIGDVEKLRVLPIEPSSDCELLFQQAILTGKLSDQVGARESLDKAQLEGKRVIAEAFNEWLALIELSVTAHPSTLTMVPIGELLASKGLLETLRQRGYTVEEP